jgi:hypothetical protein
LQPPYSAKERVADADRELAAEQLRQHLLAGRLSAAEFETRVGSVQSATTRGDLDSALADLPQSSPDMQPAVMKGDLGNRI